MFITPALEQKCPIEAVQRSVGHASIRMKKSILDIFLCQPEVLRGREKMKASIGLCMVVKNEIDRITGCIEPIFDLLDRIVIVDDGSTDGTPELLKRRFGIEVVRKKREDGRTWLSLSDLKNTAFDRTDTPWLLSLDADERIAPQKLERFSHACHERNVSGYFGPWINHIGDQSFEDYKLFLFRKGFHMRGIIHENVQLDIRLRGGQADWLDYLQVSHYPEQRKDPERIALRRRRSEVAIQAEPAWYRYHWFLGLLKLAEGNRENARMAFSVAAQANSTLFPVECLNSRMMLAELLARQGVVDGVRRELDAALAFHERVADDFEVKINFRLKPWLDRARAHAAAGKWDAIRAYRFAW
uniref:Glycosyl transferase family 2 n=1 Tax=Candidatus Kentrum sp. FM TaxID=2126340 RepID=A0A450TU35_9GAMM|nr:MAG: Glycosyl transferase family 2 [Candidatus Kentron sp. FM]VFJ72647.1 MAG: Glycosyl transferase family 2 [Candidatus Kentron sp. FM]VFK19776.1 MAG: Glycosyl transferase family 2 [Candidatus Kentron sp. FM]